MSRRLPSWAAWRHVEVREGFEVVFFRDGVAEGTTTGVEDGEAWVVGYRVEFDAGWRTSRATVTAAGRGSVELVLGDDGRWRVDGEVRPDLDGVLDVDLESSSFTNAFPVNRIRPAVGETVQAPAAWVRLDLSVERLDQEYTRLPDEDGDVQVFDYLSRHDGFRSVLRYDRHGLALDYPGIAVRAR